MEKQLDIPNFAILDSMNMEDVCDFLEQESQKHSID